MFNSLKVTVLSYHIVLLLVKVSFECLLCCPKHVFFQSSSQHSFIEAALHVSVFSSLHDWH